MRKHETTGKYNSGQMEEKMAGNISPAIKQGMKIRTNGIKSLRLMKTMKRTLKCD